jgi:hypothetical protein
VRQRYSRLLVLKRLTTAGTVKSEVTVEVGATCLQVQAVDRGDDGRSNGLDLSSSNHSAADRR